jgi:sodium/hydrogen antiporter
MAAADPVTAAALGLEFADSYVLGLLFAGIAVFAAVGALSHQHDRAFSASLIYLVLGVAAAAAIHVFDLSWLDPIEDAKLFEKVTELAVIIALFATGLKLDRPLRWGPWTAVRRLLVIAMPLTIGGVTLFATGVMDLSLGAALILGAILAPTDPVLAGDIGVGPPGEEEERDPNFSVTGEAGLNDGLAFPFLFAGVLIAQNSGGTVDFLLADVLYAVVVGLAAGAALGHGIAALAVWLRDRELLSAELDPWLAIGAVLVVYGVVESLSAYGFLAAFAGGVAFRRYESGHEYNARVHSGAETVEKFGELAVVLLVASTLTLTGLGEPGLTGWLLVAALLVVIRPASVAVALVRTRMPLSHRAFVGWFGVRGVGSVYYAAVAVGTGVLTQAETRTIVWTTLGCVIVSIVVHGLSASPLGRVLLPDDQPPPA